MTAQAPRVLVVSGDPRWVPAAREAAAAAGGTAETVSAPQALLRLAGPGPGPTHVLIDPAWAGALAPTLALLSAERSEGGALAAILGPAGDAPPGTGSIADPNRTTIGVFLDLGQPPARDARPALTAWDLSRIVSHRLIETRYQPIVGIADGAVRSVEVLARLRHPRHGAVPPTWFVARFEDSGLALALTGLVSRLAFEDRTDPAFPGIAIAINHPLDVLCDPDCATMLDEQRVSWNLAPGDIHIELTESRPVEDFATLGRSVGQLRDKGYRVSIDDAGPAVPDLDRLMTLPFSGLKLDKPLVDQLGVDRPETPEAATIVEKALARGFSVVAEGIETRAVWDRLKALGVTEAQGFFISRPLPAAGIGPWREAWNQTRAPDLTGR